MEKTVDTIEGSDPAGETVVEADADEAAYRAARVGGTSKDVPGTEASKRSPAARRFANTATRS
jgi:hypothetical protein